ncbi:MAG: histidine phosphatase family protein [Nocardioides sp.]
MRLTLVRHGRTASNTVLALDTAIPGASLDEIGQAQAVAVAPALARLEPDSLWASTLVRTQQTAAPLARLTGLEPQLRDGIREIDAGDLEMVNEHKALEAYFDQMLAWALDDLDHRLPGGISGHEFLERFDSVVHEIAASSQRAVLFSHGAAIRTWVSIRVTDPLGERFAGHPKLDNTAHITIEGEPSAGWELVDWVDAAQIAAP